MNLLNKKWTLFLDRDGVINKRIPNDYVRNPDQFTFLPGSLEAIVTLNDFFKYTFVVTNQQGVGKGLMTIDNVEAVHAKLETVVEKANGKLDKIYYCPHVGANNPVGRKPNIGMGRQAKMDFPTIDFSKAVMVGDSISDMEFGHALGMKTVFITTKHALKKVNLPIVDYCCSSLQAFARYVQFVNKGLVDS